MKILIRQVYISDSHSAHFGTIKDILINDGLIVDIADHLEETPDQIISEENLLASPGWLDIFSNFADPGYEFKEDLYTGAQAAAAGGYTDVFLIPNTNPTVDIKAQVEYI